MPVFRTAVKAFSVALLVLLMSAAVSAQSSTGSHTHVTDERLMTDADYKIFLLQVEAVLPKWETQLKSIDLEKVPQISY